MKYILLILTGSFLFSCTVSKKLPKELQPGPIAGLKFLGEKDIPLNFQYNGTTVGGLSGIDYDPGSQQYYLICDDRSAINPARFYTARIALGEKGIDSIRFVAVTSLLQPNGQVYPNNKQDRFHVPDPEAMRFDPHHRQLTWSSEGERILNDKDTVLLNPSINIIGLDGHWIDSLALPSILYMQKGQLGPRQNSVLEGLDYDVSGQQLYVSVEEPLFQDGPRADTFPNKPYIRIFQFDTHQKTNTAQYAYELDPIARPSVPAAGYKINGISDIMIAGPRKLLVIERSFSTGHLACTIRIYIADLDSGTDISAINSLAGNTSFKPLSKKLLLNMDSLGIYIDNIEGATWGPVLPNGHRSILFIADNNFSIVEKSQVLLFEVLE